MKTVKKPLKWLIILIAAEMILVALITILFDPFYQYHGALPGTKTVLYDRDNQVPGTIRTLEYDSVLLGSSVAENFDSEYLDALYDCQTLKIIRASGSVADLLYYLEQAHENQTIQHVFWCLDIFALTSSTEVTLYSDNTPRYLHTQSVLDDFTYLFNKDILFEEIPYSLAFSLLDRNTGGNAYNWAEGKEFGVEKAKLAYIKPETSNWISDGLTAEYRQLVAANIEMVIQEVTTHPNTEYTFLFPPYSLLWWDSGYVNGLSPTYLYALEQILPALVALDNVSVHFFMSEQDIVCDLNNYMDMVHYRPEVNQYMLDCVSTGSHLVTDSNLEEVLDGMKETVDSIVTEKIYDYYPQ